MLRIPDGFAGYIFPRSGLSTKGIVCELPPIDSSYTGEVHAIISNVGSRDYEIKAGDKMDYAFRDIYMIATAAEEEESAFEKAYNGLQGWVDCFEKAKLKGLVTGGGIGDANDAPNHEETMKRAYELGKIL